MLLLALASRGDADPHGETWHGRTAQGRSVTVYVVDGRVKAIRTSAIVTCPTNTYVDWVNRPTDEDLSIVDTWDKAYGDGRVGHGTTTVRAKADDHSLRGTVRMAQRIDTYRCDSGPVGFSAD